MQKLPDSKELNRLYWDEGLTQKEIGGRYGVTRAAVSLALIKAGIPTRRGFESYFLRRGVTPPSVVEIIRLYWDKEMSTGAIARKFGVSRSYVQYHLQKHGIRRRTCAEAMKLRRTLPGDDVLLRLYWNEEMSFAMIGEKCGVAASVVGSAFKHRGLKSRTREEARRLKQEKGRGRKLPSNEELLRLYWDEKMSYRMIADCYGTSTGNISAMFIRNNLKRRTRTEAQRVRHERNKDAR